MTSKKTRTASTKTVRKPSTRLKPTEQVKDRKKAAIGFGAVGATYEPLTNLSIEQIRQLILTTVWAETCINTIVDEVVKYPLYTDPTNEKIDAFLKYPSEKDPLFMVRKKYLKDMLRWGNGACIIESKSGNPIELVVAPGYTLRVTDDNPPEYKFLKIGSSSEFKKDANETEIQLTNKELMHFAIDADSDSTLARSPIERAYNDIVSDKESAKKVVEFIKRGFYKPAFISFKKGASVNKKDLIEFIEYLNGLMVEGAKILGINKEADLTAIPYWDSKDIIEMQRWIGLKIASVYKVPPFMLNLVQDVGSLNAREQKSRFLENVIMPILEYESYIYNMVLVRRGFKNLETEITSPVLGTKLNYDRARIANLLVGGEEGLLTVTEARKLFFNLDPKKASDTPAKETPADESKTK